MNSAPWFLYLVRTRKGALYTGITLNVSKRLAEHEAGKKGAKYLRSKGPLQLAYAVDIGSRSLASQAEYRIKRLPKSKKEHIAHKRLTRLELLQYLKLDTPLPAPAAKSQPQ